MRSKLAALAPQLLLLFGFAQATPAVAASAAVPPAGIDRLAGSTPGDLISSRPGPEEVRRALARIARDSDGRVRLGIIGRTNEGRPVRLASVGHGATRLLYVTQQHGDEPLGTPAAVRALWALGVRDDAVAPVAAQPGDDRRRGAGQPGWRGAQPALQPRPHRDRRRSPSPAWATTSTGSTTRSRRSRTTRCRRRGRSCGCGTPPDRPSWSTTTCRAATCSRTAGRPPRRSCGRPARWPAPTRSPGPASSPCATTTR